MIDTDTEKAGDDIDGANHQEGLGVDGTFSWFDKTSHNNEWKSS